MSDPSARAAPRSVSDPDAQAYDEMIRRQRALRARQESDAAPSPRTSSGGPPPSNNSPPIAKVEGPLDELNFARKAREKWEHGERLDALTDGIQAAMDTLITIDTGRGLLKGGLKLDGPLKWRTKPWEEPGMRKWLGEKGFLEPGQHGHHAIIPNNGWGKSVPDVIKNQPFNIKGMKTPEQHGRIHGRYLGQPQFNAIERYWYGTPRWWKAANAWLGAEAADELHRFDQPPQRQAIDPNRFPKGSL